MNDYVKLYLYQLTNEDLTEVHSVKAKTWNDFLFIKTEDPFQESIEELVSKIQLENPDIKIIMIDNKNVDLYGVKPVNLTLFDGQDNES